MGRAQLRNNMSDALIKTINWMLAQRCFGSQKRCRIRHVGFNTNVYAGLHKLELNKFYIGLQMVSLLSKY